MTDSHGREIDGRVELDIYSIQYSLSRQSKDRSANVKGVNKIYILQWGNA